MAFGMDLGPVCGKEVIRRGKIVPTNVIPEASFAMFAGWNRCGQVVSNGLWIRLFLIRLDGLTRPGWPVRQLRDLRVYPRA